MLALAAFIGALLGALVVLVGPMLALALFGGGATWLTGNHDRGKSVLIAAFIGAAIMLTANQIQSTVMALPHSGGAEAKPTPVPGAATMPQVEMA